MKWSQLLVVLHLLVIVGLRLIVVDRRNMTMVNAESSQLDRSQWAIGVGDGSEDRDVRELLEQLVPLAVNNLLVALHNLKALIHHIQTLISAPACGKDTPEHLQDAGVGSRSRGLPPLWVVQEGAAEEPAREALGSLGTAGQSES
jgi:hypothetical protein